ncbi:MAG: hypothetical protein KAI29_20525 [Cyclobacteriaceae bacterium]|nr:hypothetical protein [Cyclobacteriaceae bacterium]MCK5703560.1 hypothetical protein [Cyclobacteriaceae bacterium]
MRKSSFFHDFTFSLIHGFLTLFGEGMLIEFLLKVEEIPFDWNRPTLRYKSGFLVVIKADS